MPSVRNNIQFGEAVDVWRKMQCDPDYVEAMKEDFQQLTGNDFALMPEVLLNTANLLAAIDEAWTTAQLFRIVEEAKRLGVKAAYKVAVVVA